MRTASEGHHMSLYRKESRTRFVANEEKKWREGRGGVGQLLLGVAFYTGNF